MFAAKGHLKNKGKAVSFRAKNFFKWKVWPVADELGIPRKLCTFQVLRRTLGTDLQKHGTMKDVQATTLAASVARARFWLRCAQPRPELCSVVAGRVRTAQGFYRFLCLGSN
jgi:hypothetical protein